MKTYIFLFLFSVLSLSPDRALEKRVEDLEAEVADLTNLIINNDIRARLSFGLNRDFITSGNYYSSWNEDSSKFIYHFDGYVSKTEFDKKYKEQKIFLAQNFIQKISEIIIGRESEWRGAILEINFYDIVYSKEPFVTATTENKSIKIRLAGIMTEIAWP